MDQVLADQLQWLIEETVYTGICMPSTVACHRQLVAVGQLLEFGSVLRCSPRQDRTVAILLVAQKGFHQPVGHMGYL